jgi:hypothetical protein
MQNEQQLLTSYRALPANMQAQVFNFIRFLWTSFQEKQQIEANLLEAIRPLRQSISIEEIKKEQIHKKPSRENVRSIAQLMNLQEPVEDLLNELNP